MRRQFSSLFICLLITTAVAQSKPASEQAQASNMPEASEQLKIPKNTVLDPQEIADLQQQIYQYEQAISDIESSHGAYGKAMGQQLDSLGLVYQKLGKHPQAIEVFKRAVHITRIHEGLYSPQQLPILERELRSLTALGQWKEVNDKLQYLYWLNKMNYGDNDPRILPALSRLSRWHLQAYALELGRDKEAVTDHLITAHNMIVHSVNLLEQTGQDRELLINQLNGLTLTNYLFATYTRVPMPRTTSNNPIDQEIRRASQSVDVYINHSFRAGRDAIMRVIDLYQNGEEPAPFELAKAKVKLGDWLFLFNKRNAAFANYSEAWQILSADADHQPKLKSLFDQPVALPSEDLLETNHYYQAERTKYSGDNHYVLASFDVTELGKAANIEIIESMPPDNVSARSQVKRSLRVAKFRPRFVAGEPTFTENMQLRVLSH